MSPELKIIADLHVGRSTADSTAGRVGIHTGAVQVILTRLEKEGKAYSTPLGPLQVWTLASEFRTTLPPNVTKPTFPK